MKAVVLAGGRGTRFAEETHARPKPMIEIGGIPMIRHIVDLLQFKGIEHIIIACGYMGESLSAYFANNPVSTGTVECVDTGDASMTGGRVLRLREKLEGGTFLVTYGDGLADVDLATLGSFHRTHGRIATVTAVHPPGRFGRLRMEGDQVKTFAEKEDLPDEWINGGFFVFEPALFSYLDSDQTILERGPIERLCAEGQLMAYRHEGFWQHMDTIHERQILEELWAQGRAPWKPR